MKACEATLRFRFPEPDYCVTKQLPPAAFNNFADADRLVARRPRSDADAEVDALLAEIGLLDLR